MRILNIFVVIVVLLAGCENDNEGIKCVPGYPDCPIPTPQPESK